MTQLPGHPDIGEQAHSATLLDENNEQHQPVLEELRADPGINFIDTLDQQRDTLSRLRPPVTDELRHEPPRWAYYPWRRAVVRVLGPESFATLRLDRNRNLITAAEQRRLSRLRVGVVGLSVGHVIAHTLALQGVAGELRLADFDELELSNLNRVPATVFDLGVNKAVIAARRIAELNPYMPVDAYTEGLSADTIDEFLDGLDVLVEECDSLDIKVVVREAARARGIPVLMSTSDRGLIDVERFDVEPHRPVLHGLLRGIDSSNLAGLTTRQKIPHMLRFLDVSQSSARAAASMVEVNSTLTTWPQLAGEVILGAGALVEAVRRLGLDEPLPSGRTRVDIAAALDALEQPQLRQQHEPADTDVDTEPTTDVAQVIAAAASQAPSAGNAQPWTITAGEDWVTVALDPRRTSTLDIAFRGSAVAVGAATFNARVAAAAHGVVGSVTATENNELSDTGEVPLQLTVVLGSGADDDLARLYRPMLTRRTNRRDGPATAIDTATMDLVTGAAADWGGQLHLLTDPDRVAGVASVLAACDRIRYLTPTLHGELLTEVRWPEDPAPADSRIDALSLELDDEDFAALDILRRPEVMKHLAAWGAGTTLGNGTFDRVRASSALGVLTVRGNTLSDFARGGTAAEAAWITANHLDIGVHPVSPLFLYALDDHELVALSPSFGAQLRGLRDDFRRLAQLDAEETAVIVLRFTTAGEPTGSPSRRRVEGITRRSS